MGHGLENKRGRPLLNKACREWYQLCTSHLFNAVGVDGGLWLQYADWFGFLGTLGHFADFLRNEVVDTIEGLDRTLYQADALCCSCEGGEGQATDTKRYQWARRVQKWALGGAITRELPLLLRSSTFASWCLDCENVPWHVTTSQLRGPVLLLDNQRGRSWKETCLFSEPQGGRRIPPQWCNSFTAAAPSVSLPCSSNRLNTNLCSSSRLLSTPTLRTLPVFRCHGKGDERWKQVMQQWVFYTCLHDF